jgi:hypothetical protein
MASAWNVKPAASWADNVDEEEEQSKLAPPPAKENPDFPTLGEAIKVAPKAKKKGKTLGLGEFLVAGPGRPVALAVNKDRDILSQLPTAPRGDRGEGDMDAGGGMGGGFKEYGGYRGGRPPPSGLQGPPAAWVACCLPVLVVGGCRGYGDPF